MMTESTSTFEANRDVAPPEAKLEQLRRRATSRHGTATSLPESLPGRLSEDLDNAGGCDFGGAAGCDLDGSLPDEGGFPDRLRLECHFDEEKAYRPDLYSDAFDVADGDLMLYDLEAEAEDVLEAADTAFQVDGLWAEAGDVVRPVAASFDPASPRTTLHDQFVWGSITKISTGAAVLQLAQQGKLSLNDTIPQYVDPLLMAMKTKDPSLNFSSAVDIWGPEVNNVTIYHLATMNSGIPDFDTAKPYPPPPVDPLRTTIYDDPSHDFTPPELLSLPWVFTGKLEFTPGQAHHGFAYSSTNFILLGLVLSYHAGAANWDDFDQSTFLPAEVKAKLPSVEYVQHGGPSNITRMHGYDRTSYNNHSATALPGVDVYHTHGVFGGWTASDYTSTVSDAAILAYEVYGPSHRIIDQAHQDIMIPKCDKFCIYGFATFNITDQMGQSPTLDPEYNTAYGHIGATYGFDTMLTYHPKLDLTMAIASNMENDDQTHPSDTLCALYGVIKAALAGSKEKCTYTPKGYYGGECKCAV